MAHTNFFVYIILFLCNQLAIYVAGVTYLCTPEIETTDESAGKYIFHPQRNSSTFVSVFPLKNQLTDSNETCKAYLTLHGKYGTSLPTPIDFHRQPHCSVQADLLGGIDFATITQQSQDTECKWHPIRLQIYSSIFDKHQDHSCKESMWYEQHRRLRRSSFKRILNVEVHTANELGAGTDAAIYLTLHGSTGSSGPHTLSGDYEKNSKDWTQITVSTNIGFISRLRVRLTNSGWFSEWKLDKIRIHEKGQRILTASCNCWTEDTTREIQNKCSDIKYCGYQLCDTCHSCQDADNDYFYRLSNSDTACDKCPWIENCERKISEHGCGTCKKCQESGTSAEYSVFWLTGDQKQCNPTCSWKKRWCWPGLCSGPNHWASDCVCESGFKRVPSAAKCDSDSTLKPELLTCKTGIEDSRTQVKNSTSLGNNTGCSTETDTYVNIVPVSMSFTIVAHFTKKITSPKRNYIQDTKLGIVNGKVIISKIDVIGRSSFLSTIPLFGGGNCDIAIHSSNPTTSLDCGKNVPVTTNMEDGDRICAKIEISSGGSFTYQDFSGTYKGRQDFSPVVNYKTLCFKYDTTQPVHCAMTSPCNQVPFSLSTHVTKSANITVSISGWFDPHPQHGKLDQASGVDFYKLEVYGMKQLGLDKLTVDYANHVFTSQKMRGPSHNITVTLPDEPAMYATYLEVHDVAGNVRFARRFLLYDNTSTLDVRQDKHLRVVSASNNTYYKWQINHGKIRLDWKHRYHNDYYMNNDFFAPIKADTGNSISGVYEQNTGVLPVTGTESVNGITSFKYQWALNNGSKTPWTLVPDFTNQSLSLKLNLADGETYEVWIKAEDIMENSIVESVVVHIDRSVAIISDTWLVREGTRKIYVHNNTDLSTMVLQFRTFDVHSGIHSVLWTLGTSNAASDIGNGALPVVKLNIEEGCPSKDNCYCPSVGPCEYQNYTLTLNSLAANNTETGQHNREYYFTLYITNSAMSKSLGHLDVLVDDSAPEVGVVQEGTAGFPDVDYTSEDHVVISWGGFVDHESGIREYIVGISNKCLTIKELREGKMSDSIFNTKSETTSIRFPAEGKYFTSITALNNALEPSAVVCSDGITFDSSSPVIENIHLHQAAATPSVHCIDNRVWLVNPNLTMTELPATPRCIYKCSLYNSQSNLRFPVVKTAYMNNKTAESFCKDLEYLHNTIIYIPFDKILLNWSISEHDSQIKYSFIGVGSDSSRLKSPDLVKYQPANGKTEFRLHRTGLGGSTQFYIFIEVKNKAGLSTTATLGPVLIDDTPPIIHKQLKLKVFGEHVRATWDKGTFSDPEQADNQFTVTYRAVMDDKFVTPVLETPSPLRMTCQSQGFADCIQYPLHNLQLQDSEMGKPCLFELYVYNAAGHFTTVRTESILLPSRFPPGPATVADLDPETLDSLTDVDFHRNNSACVHWFGFHHHKNVTLELGIGTARGLDDVSHFTGFITRDQFINCVTTASLKPFTRYFSSIRANCSGGSTVSSSDGFVIVADVPNTVTVNDGLGCEPADKYLIDRIQVSTIPKTVANFSVNIPLHVGLSYSLSVLNTSASYGLLLRSDDIVTQDTFTDHSSYHVAFVPLIRTPVFKISSLNTSDLVMTLHTCLQDSDCQPSTTTYSLNWRVEEPYGHFLTHFKISLFESVCKVPQNRSCLLTVKEADVNAGHSVFTFSNIQLHKNKQYVGSVTPCFEHACLSRRLSDGVKVAKKPTVGSVVSGIGDETSDCTSVSLEVSGINCGEATPNVNISQVIQWAIMKSESDVSPLTKWERIDVLKIKCCKKLPVHSYQKLISCVRLFCPSGQFTKKCVQVTLNPYSESYSDHVLYELPADDSRLVDIEDLLHSKHLGSKLRLLHEMDVDYVSVNSRLSAAITNSAGHNITWYMMRGKPEIPGNDCDSDVSCVASKTSQNGHIRFGKIDFDESEPYYVCAKTSDRERVPGFKVCGNGFIVDNSPPVAGSVEIRNTVSGFITDASHMYITWSGFRDIHPDRSTSQDNGIKVYSLAIGTYQQGTNIHPWTRVGDSTTYAASGIPIKNGQEYFVTVRAEDHVGHVTESVSPGVLADLTPPLCGDIRVEGLLPHKSVMTASSLHIHLKGVQDPESSIQSLHLNVLTAANTDSPQIYVKQGTDFVNIKVDDSFVDGHKYKIHIQVINNAGLHSTCNSRPFILDNSPPEAGVVREGDQNTKVESDHETNTTELKCHWSGFSDPHSSIQDYRVGLGTSPDTPDVQPLRSVGLATNHTWLQTFLPGVKYYSIVEACNGAGLCSAISSDGVIMNSSPPVAGLVIVGHTDTHSKYHGHRSYVYSHWVGFEDAETGIHHFESCIGLNIGSCDVTNFTNTALSDSYLATGLHLPRSVPLYVTVRAYNPVGLFVAATSPSFIVDDTPPVVIEQPFFISTSDGARNITTQWDNSLVHVAWKFLDSESPVHEHVLTFRTHHESSVAIETIILGPQQSYLLVLEKDNRLRNGDKYQVSVSSCNRAGLCSTSHSPDILIDSTPPLLGGFKPPLNWKRNSIGGSTMANVTLTWYGFSDVESNISHYHISVGRTYEGAELTHKTVVVHNDENIDEQSATLQLLEPLRQGEDIVLSIWAENSIGLPSSVGRVTVSVVSTHHTTGYGGILELQRHSCDVHYCTGDCTCAVVGSKCTDTSVHKTCTDLSNSTSVPDVLVYPGTSAQPNVSAIPSLSCIAGHWDTVGNSMVGIRRYEWSMGLQGQQIGEGIFDILDESIWYDIGKQTEIIYCLPYDRSLQHGEDYVIYVRAWYTDTEYRVFTSDSIRVDHTPPAVRRGKLLLDSDETCQKDFDIFHVNQSSVTACWSGIFQETQTRLKEYTVWAGVTKYGTDLLPEQSVGLSTIISLPAKDILPGTKYYVGVRAVNTLNMSTTVISDGFLLDGDQPLSGHVFNTEQHRNILAQSENTSISVSWNGFQDHHSSVGRYLIQVKECNSSDPIVELTASLRNSLLLDNIHLEHGKRYTAFVAAEDFTGHIGEVVESQPVLIDATPPVGFVCQNFARVPSVNVSYEMVNITFYTVTHFSVTLPEDVDSYFRIEISIDVDDLDNEMALFVVGQIHGEAPFTAQQNNSVFSAEYQFMQQTGISGSNQLEITIQGKQSFENSNISLEYCSNKVFTSGPAAITTKQLMPSLLSICTRLMDPESGLRNIHIGVGTTRGGYQIQTLRPTVARFHELLDVDVPHGTPIFTTVIAENHAGLKAYFMSEPIIIDHTPPSVTNLETHLTYRHREAKENMEVEVMASWKSEDKESALEFCWCSLGHKSLTSDILDWIPSTNSTSCRVLVLNATHRLRFYLTVQCSNTVQMNTVVSSEELQVLLQPPSTNGSFVDILVQNRYSQHGRDSIQSSTSSLQFQWEWSDSQAVSHYQCHVDGLGMTDWVNTSLRYCEFSDLQLNNGGRYTAQVRAVDGRDQTSGVVRETVTVDDTSPKLTGSRATLRWNRDSVNISYGSVFHHLSEHLTYIISVGSRYGYSDHLHQLTTGHDVITVKLPVMTSEIHVTITAEAPVGNHVTYTDSFTA